MTRVFRTALAVSTSVAIWGVPDGAWAQGTAVSAPAPRYRPAATAMPDRQVPGATPADNQDGVTDIIVTAEKRSSNLQRVPLAVTAVSQSQLSDAGVTETRDLVKVAPSLNISQSGPQSQFSIRGAGSVVLNAFGDASVAFNVDGVYIARPTGAAANFYDLERAEVLKGPQGTLYGRNATAGTINLITRKPEFDNSGRIEAELGNYSRRRLAGDINLAAGDTLAVRGAFQIVKRDGYYSDGYDDEDSKAARLHLLWRPSTTTSLLISGDYAAVGGKGNVIIPFPYVNPGNPRLGPSETPISSLFSPVPVAEYGRHGVVDVKNWGISAQLDQALTDHANLTVLAAHRDSRFSGLYYPGNFFIQPDIKAKQDSVEVRLSSTHTNRFEWLVGGYFYRESTRSRQVSIQQDRGVFLDASTFTGVNRQIVRGTDVNLQPITDQTFAAFGQATYGVTDWLRLTAGGRYTTETKTKSGFSIIYSPALPGGTRTLNETGRQKIGRFNYKVGTEVDVARHSMLYGSVSTGFKAGGFFPGAAPSAVNPLANSYSPEETTAFAIGLKNQFFDNHLRLNVEAFRYNIKGRQYNTFVLFNTGTAVNGPFGQGTVNTQRAHIMGVEADLEARIFRHGNLNVALEYVPEADADQFVFQQVFVVSACPIIARNTYDCSGRRLNYSPKFAGSVAYHHEFALANGGQIVPRASVRFQSSVAGDFVPTPLNTIGAYAVADAGLAYNAKDKRFSAELFVNNFTDTLYRKSALAIAPTYSLNELGAPRTYGVRVGVNF